MDSLSQNPRISTDPETQGFDLSAGETWIYPENYPIRKYQFDIVQTALYNNTLVCLPTGLGKTFIATVVMYNYWRWYPGGKVVFLAPTRPLVAQQIYACHNTMGIPSIETIELTGAVNQKQREIAWFKKRVIFATPQVFHNDLEKNIVPAELIKCVVIDEAHKALGKHSYSECIRILAKKCMYFRILALSATPGNKIDNVHEILQNLRISHLELRDEMSPDVVPYINQRKIDVIVVPLSAELEKFKERYIFIMDHHVKYLLQHNILQSEAANISKGRVFHLLREFQKKNNRPENYGYIIKTLNILMTMSHAYELIVRDGLRAFHKFYQNHSDKFWMNDEYELQNLLKDIDAYLGPFPDTKSIPDGRVPDIPTNIVFGHTKFEKLKELLFGHFISSKEKKDDTRAIVFVEYRDIVHEIYILLLQLTPLIRPQILVGQAGLKQKQQIKALEDFRNNRVNVLISTSIGEEGLDIGEVDLIVCFDISQQSPTRLVQRMGRTGRKRDGHIIILVTDGREYQTLKSTMARRDSINNKILNTDDVFSSLYEYNPRMIPHIFNPKCHKIFINMQPNTLVKKTVKKGKVVNKKESKRQTADTKDNVTEPYTTQVKGRTQCSLKKFLKNEKSNVSSNNIFGSRNFMMTQSTSINNTIKPYDVKLLTSDDDAVDFLTLCTLKKSRQETNTSERKNHNMFYTRMPAPTKNFFSLSVPKIEILDCLHELNNMIFGEYREDEDRGIETDGKAMILQDENISYVNKDAVVACSRKFIPKRTSMGESRFEDLLDESSSSDDGQPLEDVLASSTSSPETFPKPRESNESSEVLDDKSVKLQDLTLPGVFEDILNESFDSDEGDDSNQVYKVMQNEQHVPHDIKVGRIETYLDGHNTLPVYDKNVPGVHQSLTKNKHCVQNEKSNLTDSSGTNEKDMFGITQMINEIARRNSGTKVVQNYNDNPESEDDMFEIDDIIRDEFNSTVNIDLTAFKADAYQLKNTDKHDGLDSMEEACSSRQRELHANSNFKVVTNKENDIDEWNKFWDEDFEICTKPIEKSSSFINTLSLCSTSDRSNNTLRVSNAYDLDLNLGNLVNSSRTSAVSQSLNETGKSCPNPVSANRLVDVKSSTTSKLSSTFAGHSDRLDNPEDNSILSDNELWEVTGFENNNFLNKSKDKGVEQSKSIFTDRNSRKRNGHAKGEIRKRVKSDFINDEVEVSFDVLASTDEDEGEDDDLVNFVSHSQYDIDDMRACYLQSIKSPINRPDGFVFKRPRTLSPSVNIYSQPLSQLQEDTYVYDSFCVADDEVHEEPSSHHDEYSILEEAELILKKRKRKRTRKESSRDNARKLKKKHGRICVLDTSISSEDETEQLRKQVQEESSVQALAQ